MLCFLTDNLEYSKFTKMEIYDIKNDNSNGFYVIGGGIDMTPDDNVLVGQFNQDLTLSLLISFVGK